jgi:glucose/arabinose dehydrogenase
MAQAVLIQFTTHAAERITLIETSLIFIELKDRRTVGQVLKVDVGERIRDLEISSAGQIVATTDSGKILFIQNN